jgi:hypothetical protein
MDIYSTLYISFWIGAGYPVHIHSSEDQICTGYPVHIRCDMYRVPCTYLLYKHMVLYLVQTLQSGKLHWDHFCSCRRSFMNDNTHTHPPPPTYMYTHTQTLTGQTDNIHWQYILIIHVTHTHTHSDTHTQWHTHTDSTNWQSLNQYTHCVTQTVQTDNTHDPRTYAWYTHTHTHRT